MITPIRPGIQRRPPANIEAEQGVLGTILKFNRSYADVSTFLAPEHFSLPVHARIYAALGEVISHGSVADPTSLKGRFDYDVDLLALGGGTRYLAELARSAVTLINAEHYARAIVEAARRRAVIDGATDLIEQAYEGNAPIDSALEQVVRALGSNPAAIPSGLVDAAENEWIPPREWLLGTTFCRQFLSSLVGPGGTGKTALRIAQALAVATGRPLTGEHVHHRARVLYITLEDSMDELRRRVRAARRQFIIDSTDLAGWFFLWAPPRDAKMAEKLNGGIATGSLVAMLRRVIADRRIDLVIFDPFIKSYGGNIDENSNSEIDAVAQLIVQLAIELNFAPDVLHHDAKGTREAGDINRGRGASSMRDAARLGQSLTTMTTEEAAAFGIAENQRRSLVRLDSTKINLTPASDAQWFELVPVSLGNSTADYPSGDTVQSIEPWTAPNAWSDVSHSVLNDALSEIDRGLDDGRRYSDAPNAQTTAAWKIMQKHSPGKTERQCRNVITVWVKNGVLFHEEYFDKSVRKQKQGLRLNPAKRPS